jgi:DNA-binding transcriptional LysR family regulator
MQETSNLEKGRLSIGMPSNIGSFYVFDKIIEFHKLYPNIEITIITGSTSNLVNLLESHTIDFIIDTPPFKNLNNEIKIKKLATVNYCFIAHKNFNKKITSLKQLINEQLILPIPNTANRKDLDDIFIKYQVNIENFLNIHTTEMIIAAVKQNLGIGYVIEDLVKNEIKNKELTKLDIKESLPTIDINLVYNPKYITTAPLKFITDFLKCNI